MAMSNYEALYQCWTSGQVPPSAIESHLKDDEVLAAWWRRREARARLETGRR